LGWNEGRNVRIDHRWAAVNEESMRRFGGELVALQPDVIVTQNTPNTAAVQQQTRTIPIIFTQGTDPIGAGFVASLPRPGGNVTGFINLEASLAGKWLELLKQIAPHVKLAAVIRNPSVASGSGQLGAIQAVAPFLGMETSPVDVRDAGEIERGMRAVASANAGVIVTANGHAIVHRDLIISLAARFKLPAVYWARVFATSGGLLSYGDDTVDHFRRAAAYIDRIFKGENPADLPVQAPTKYELVINLKTAKALGLEVPPTLIARADEVIE
jgi:putative tryptophan/tyrosine transport system substrate-binding protein